MKKLKTLALLLSVAVLSCSMIACGDKDDGHTHTFDTAHWSKNETHHWHEATCGHSVKPEDSDGYAMHTTDGVCVCGKTAPESGDKHTSHNWSKTYTIDGDQHYQTCDGCDEKNYDGHDYGTSGVCVCGKTEPEAPVTATGVKLDKDKIELKVGENGKLTATVEPENATDKNVTYSVEPAGIVSVDKNGNVTALAEGTAVITATTANGKAATCTVTVSAAIENVQDLIANYGAEVKAAINESYYDDVVNKAIKNGMVGFNESKIADMTWKLNTDSNGNIDKINLLTYYNTNSTHTTLILSSIELNNPISIKDMTKENINESFANSSTSAAYNKIYSFTFDPTIQETRADLTNAICDNVLDENADCTRYIYVDNPGQNSELGQFGRFTVVQISEYSIKQTSINIKYSTNDSDYIDKLNNISDYETSNVESYDISGIKVVE